jgi:hypothetical protein
VLGFRGIFREYFPPLALPSNVPPPLQLIIAYTAQNGLFNALNDWAHKYFSPSSYESRLCHFTYGLTGMLRPWTDFLESVPYPTIPLHREEFRKAYIALDVRLPAILADRRGRVLVLVSAGELEVMENLSQLIELTLTRLRLREQGSLEPVPALGRTG